MLGSDYNSGRELNILNKGGIMDMETGVDLNGVWHAVCVHAQSCLTPSNPMDFSPPGSSVHGTFQTRVLEWGATAFSITDTNTMLHYKSGFPGSSRGEEPACQCRRKV